MDKKRILAFEPWFFIFFGLFHLHRIWGLEVFGDAVIANAIIDRLVHHCDIVKITGHSYRIKGRNIFDETDD